MALPNGITTSYQYDNLNRLTQLTHKKADALVASYSYELLPTGRRAAVTEVTPEGSSEIRYTYDSLYRLTGETRTGVKPFTASYAYDINSNRTQKIISGPDENDTINYTWACSIKGEGAEIPRYGNPYQFASSWQLKQ